MSTYYDWNTGRPAPAGMVTMPRLGVVSGGPYGFSGLPVAAPHPAAPTTRFPTYTAGPMGRTVPYDPNLYKKPAATTPAKPGTPGIPTIDQIIRQIYGTIETPAQQEARVNREVNTQIAAQQKMIDDMYARQRADALAMMQGQAAAGAAAAAMSKDLFGAVGGEFNSAAGEIKGLSHGLTGGTAALTKGDIGAANKNLEAMAGGSGNIPVQAGAGGGPLAPGGATQAGVVDYQQGTLGSQLLTSLGEAENFGLAGLISSQNLRATQEAEAELHTTLADLRGKESDAINALAAGRLDLYHQYKQDAADSRIKALTMVQGLIAQKQATAQANAKLQAQYARDALAQANRDRQFGLSTIKAKASITQGNQRIAQGQTRLDQGQQRINDAQAATNARLQIARANLTIAQDKTMRASIKDAIAAGAVDVNRSKAVGHVVDKQGKPITDANGKWIPSSMLSTTKGKTLTPGQASTIAQKAQNLIPQWFYGTKSGSGKPGGRLVSADQAPGFDANDITTWGKQRISYVEAQRRLQRMKVPRQQALNMLNEYWYRGQGGRPWLNLEERAAAVKQFGSRRVDQLLLKAVALAKTNYNQAAHLIDQLLKGGPIPIGV